MFYLLDANETSVYKAFLIGAIVLGAAIVFFIVAILRQQKLNHQLYIGKIHAEIKTLENERGRIATDLHDELGTVLLAVKFQISSLDINNDEDQITLEATNGNIDSIINRMREISNNLMPQALVRKGLVTALEEFIQNAGRKTPLQIKMETEKVPELPPEKSIHIFRILQELIHNTIKHANAGELLISLEGEQEMLRIFTVDNGVGFNHQDAVSAKKGLGLTNLDSRTEILSGKMYIESRPGKGTRYTFEIPLPAR